MTKGHKNGHLIHFARVFSASMKPSLTLELFSPNIFAFPFSVWLVSIPMSELRLHMVDYTRCLVPVKISKLILSSGVLLMAVLSGLTLCGFIDLKGHIDKPCCEHVLSASVVLDQYLIHAHTCTCTQTKHCATLSAEFSYFPSNLSNA